MQKNQENLMLQLTQPQQQQANKLVYALSRIFISFPRQHGKTALFNSLNGSTNTTNK
jgi:hypothetical protein